MDEFGGVLAILIDTVYIVLLHSASLCFRPSFDPACSSQYAYWYHENRKLSPQSQTLLSASSDDVNS